ncbi:type III restriction protein res subunit [Alicyclobacillus hesperidum URH17-3-68]|nr:type III restriction protein res subunit [Alicyclobacillus hesperidum URH17-3-68]
MVASRDKPILVIAHRTELLEQADQKIHYVWPEAFIGRIQGARNEQLGDVLLASTQTLVAERRELTMKISTTLTIRYGMRLNFKISTYSPQKTLNEVTDKRFLICLRCPASSQVLSNVTTSYPLYQEEEIVHGNRTSSDRRHRRNA